jgi:hypothetical protein
MSDSDEVAQLKAQLVARDAELLAERQRREAAEARTAERDAELLAERRRRALLVELRNGTYYDPIENVYVGDTEDYTRTDFDALMRMKTFPPVFGDTRWHALVRHTIVVDDPTLSRSESTTNNATVWPTDILGNEETAAHIAHLIPASSTHAGMYDDVACWTLSLTPTVLLGGNPNRPFSDEERAAVKQKAIHGTKEAKNSNRINGTGLKHSPCNKIRLDVQGEVFDRNPCLLIVPIMTLDQMKDWNGLGYEAIVMPGAWVNKKGEVTTVARVCRLINMLKVDQTASPEEIEVARVLLAAVVRGMAYSLKILEHSNLPGKSAAKLEELKNEFIFFNGTTSGVTVPIQKHDAGTGDLRVRKVTFGPVGDMTMHPAPDPLLLAVKAAVIWSTRNGQQLLAGGEVKDDTDDALSIQALEEYMAMVDQLHRPKSQEDVAAALGQRDGYHATKAGAS